MNRLVSIDHLSGTAVLKRTSEDEENDTKIGRKSQRNRGQECSGNIVGVEAGCARGYVRMLRERIRLEGWTH